MNNVNEKYPYKKNVSKRLYRDERKAQTIISLLLGLLGIAAITFIVVFSIVFYRRSTATYTKAQVVESMTKMSNVMSTAFNDRITSLHNELDVIEQFIGLNVYDSNDNEFIENLCNDLSKINFHSFETIGVLLNGKLILTSGDQFNVQQDSAIKEVIKKNVNKACISTNKEGLSDYLIFVEKYEIEGSDINYLVGLISKQTVADRLETKSEDENSTYVVISDSKGNVIVDTNSARRFGSNLIDTFGTFASNDIITTLSNDLKTGNKNTLELMGVTQRFLVYYTPINPSVDTQPVSSTSDWRLLILTSSDSLNKSISELSQKSGILLYSTITSMALALIVIGFILDLRSRKLMAKKSTDPLTGYLNSTRFKQDANYLLKTNGYCYAMVSINISRFKIINNTLGHSRADRIICAVADRIHQFLRKDELLARTHSDHFAVLLNMQTEQGSNRVKLLEQHITSNEYPYKSPIEVTIGVYNIKESDLDVSIPLDRARYAQLSISNNGRRDTTIAYYDDASFVKHKQDAMLEEMADFALKNDEFVVYYQLKRGLKVSDRKWIGAEALVRWENNKLGFLTPGIFVELFEKTGFIVKLDLYVFESVCKDLCNSIEQGHRVVPVSINLSKLHFERPDFMNDYIRIIEKYNIPRQLIEFEVTETLALTNVELVQEVIQQIHDMGCRCALDDFGTGFSSLDMVMTLKLDTIKLDAALFRRNVVLDDSRKMIISALIELSHKLGMNVVAEGIETEEHARFLAEKGCDAIQGFFFAKPVPYKVCQDMLDDDSLI